MFCIYENGKPCSKEGFKWATSWTNHRFETLSEARTYAAKWLGPYDHAAETLEVGKPLDYSNDGDMIEIREE